nr:hypothetical protein CFP56_56342 [Quercus suber]
MLECIRLYCMTRFQENRKKILRVESDICAKVLKRLHKEKLAASSWGEIGGNSSLLGTTNRTSTSNKTNRTRTRVASATPFAPY